MTGSGRSTDRVGEKPDPDRPAQVLAFVCSDGCCAGCSRCVGMRIGCHSRPCRCHLPCSCNYETDRMDPGCRRHLFMATEGIISVPRAMRRKREVRS